MEKKISIFNDVLGPVMRGPSSSHTAGSYYIGKLARQLLGDPVKKAVIRFDSNGSYAQVYHQQGSDLAFVTGLLGWEMTDDRFLKSMEISESMGIHIDFEVTSLTDISHPNLVEMDLISTKGKKLKIRGKSTGGGGVVITGINHWPVKIQGHLYNYLFTGSKGTNGLYISEILKDFKLVTEPEIIEGIGQVMIHIKSNSRLNRIFKERIRDHVSPALWYETEPLQYVKSGKALFSDVDGMIKHSNDGGLSLGKMGLVYESTLLDMDYITLKKEMLYRYSIMKQSVKNGLQDEKVRMKLLEPTSSSIIKNESEKKLPVGGLHTIGAAYAMAAMHSANSGGVVCAAPTGGSAGVIPGSLVSWEELKEITDDQIVNAMFAAGMIGLMVAYGATFAAEVAGCQVEIGAAGAMAAAAIVEIAGGTAMEALDAAAISFHNSMGSVCDLVQGMCEIPCHTRNAVAVGNAYVCADLIMGGYENPIPLDETIEAVLSVGKMLPPELRCTARGGLAVTPSAKNLDPS